MLSRIFPKQADNAYRGHWLALVLFALVSGLKGTQGVVSVADTRGVVSGADGIPLDTYGAAAGDTVVALTALLGFNLMLVAVLSFIVLVRYRTLIPLMFVLWLIVYFGSRAILFVNPIERAAASPTAFAGQPIGFWVNMAILAMTVIGLLLALRQRPSD